MKVDLSKIIYYGRHYKSIKSDYANLWWFCFIDYKIYHTRELIEKFKFENKDDMYDNGNFIALFKTDIIALEEKFIKEREHTDDSILRLQHELNIHDYDIVFKIYIERQATLSRDWLEYERKVLTEDAIKWCKCNGIRFS